MSEMRQEMKGILEEESKTESKGKRFIHVYWWLNMEGVLETQLEKQKVAYTIIWPSCSSQ